MAQKPDGKSARTERVTFTRPAAERIAKVVRKVEQGNRDCGGLKFDRVAAPAGNQKSHRLCKTSQAFMKGTIQTLQVYESGTPPDEVATEGQTVANVVNKYGDIASGKWVSVAKHGNGYWYVVATEC